MYRATVTSDCNSNKNSLHSLTIKKYHEEEDGDLVQDMDESSTNNYTHIIMNKLISVAKSFAATRALLRDLNTAKSL